MMELKTDIQWSEDVERYLKKVGEQCLCMSILQNRSEKWFTRKAVYLDLPVIILSTVSGSLSLSASRLFGEENSKLSTIVVGCMSISVGILSTINSYFGYSRSAENAKSCYISYMRLYRFISIQLSLPPKERIAARDLLKFVQESFERLYEVGGEIPIEIINMFKKQYRDAPVAKPEMCNGLDEIKIYGSEEKEVELSPVQKVARNFTANVLSKGKQKAVAKLTK